MKKIMIYCQHLAGMGHLVRCREIMRALSQDFKLCFVSGGQSVPQFSLPAEVEIVELPPLRQQGESVVPVDTQLSLAAVKDIRKQKLLYTFNQFQPDCLITECFPFSKWSMKDELSPLLKQAKAKARSVRVVCSLRDLIMTQPLSKGARERRMLKIRKLIDRYYDAVLVHSDPAFQRLDDCFSLADTLQCELVYTGYVAQAWPAEKVSGNSSFENYLFENYLFEEKWFKEKRYKERFEEEWLEEKRIEEKGLEEKGIEEDQSGEAANLLSRLDFASDSFPVPSIVVSAGGGRHGYPLLSAVISASDLIREIWPHKIYAFAGPFMPEDAFSRLQQSAADQPNVMLRRYTSKLLDYLNQADLSINLGGYNTTMNLLRTGVRSLLLPSPNTSQTDEQRIRAEKLADLGLVTVITPEDLVPDRLVDAIAIALTKLPTPHHLDLNGAENTADYLRSLLSPIPLSSAADSALSLSPTR